MCLYRMLIADYDEIFLSAVENVFSADFEIESCQDGETALQLLSTFQPQVLILNLSLPGMDGVTVLQQAKQLPPIIIAITNYLSDYVVQSCTELHIGYLMITPKLNALRVRVMHMVEQWQSTENTPDLHAQAAFLMHTLSIPTHRVGYRQLCCALPLYFQNRDQCLDTVLYEDIATQFQSSRTAVERAMRAVIQDAWRHRKILVWEKYFPNLTSCPSNKVFLDTMINHMKG